MGTSCEQRNDVTTKMGGTLPSTGMWQGEVFAISDCLVVPCNVLIIIHMIRRSVWSRQSGAPGPQQDHVSSTTVMCTVNSIAFVLLTTPVVIHEILLYNEFIDPNNDMFISFLLHIFYNLNSCVNFLLYCVSSQKFRKALKLLFRCQAIGAQRRFNLARVSQQQNTNL